MKLKKLPLFYLAGTLAIAGPLNLALSEPASARVNVRADIVWATPPPPRIERRIAPPARGYIWNDGYWNWQGRYHVWVPGRWMPPRRGYIWEPNVWVHEGNGWRMHEGRWQREQR